MKILSVFLFVLFSNVGLADVSVKQAKAKAIEFAKADKEGYYFGELSPEKATRVLGNTTIQRQLFQSLLNLAVEGKSGLIQSDRLKKQIEADEDFLSNFGDGEWRIVSIDYVDCDSHTNYLAVDKKTGSVYYLMSVSESL